VLERAHVGGPYVIAGHSLSGMLAVHRTIAGVTHQSLIDDRRDAAQSSRALGDVARDRRRLVVDWVVAAIIVGEIAAGMYSG
jgi:hypothetical protein